MQFIIPIWILVSALWTAFYLVAPLGQKIIAVVVGLFFAFLTYLVDLHSTAFLGEVIATMAIVPIAAYFAKTQRSVSIFIIGLLIAIYTLSGGTTQLINKFRMPQMKHEPVFSDGGH